MPANSRQLRVNVFQNIRLTIRLRETRDNDALFLHIIHNVTILPTLTNLHQGFAPVIDERTHTLILGSFPGAASLQAGQYYAFKHNQFWGLCSAVLGADLKAMAYPDCLASLLQRGIGLWDVFAACAREGSLDSAIRQGQLNDFAALQLNYPALRQLCFNGQTAGKMQPYFAALGYQTLVLPSSSPAYASMRFAEKLNLWQQIVANE